MNNLLITYTPQNTAITAAIDLSAFVPEWKINLEQRVEAQEISHDTAIGYRRGVTKFLSWLKDQQPPTAGRHG
jgi:hypothetical protein